jgi:hypothetical protein
MIRDRILFLDFDGVITTPRSIVRGMWWFDPACIARLNRLVHAIPDIRIVITTSWRASLSELAKHLTEGGFQHADRIAGRAYRDDASRGEAITAWLEEDGVVLRDAKYAILDDDCDMGRQLPHLAQTDWMHGLTVREMTKVAKLLGVVLPQSVGDGDDDDDDA